MPATLTPATKASASFAKSLFQRGTDCLGPDEVENVFGIKLAEVPTIPFSEEELQRARELGQILVLFVGNDAEGNPLTMQRLHDMLGNKLGDGKLLYEVSWYEGEAFYTTTPIVPAPIWKLVSHDVVSGSTGANYLEQTAALVRYLTEEVYKGREMPLEYNLATYEFETNADSLAELMSSDWKRAAQELADLQVNQNFRLTPGELLYLIALYKGVNKEYLLEDMYSWTASRNSVGALVSVGSAVSDGVRVCGDDPRGSFSSLGVLFSRSGLPES